MSVRPPTTAAAITIEPFTASGTSWASAIRSATIVPGP
jgi:hypothetical protein